MKFDISYLHEYEQKHGVEISISIYEVEGVFLKMSRGNDHVECQITGEMISPYLPIDNILDPLRYRLDFYILTSGKPVIVE